MEQLMTSNQNSLISDTFLQFDHFRHSFRSNSQLNIQLQHSQQLPTQCTLLSPNLSCSCQKPKGKCSLADKWIQLIYPPTQLPKLQNVFSNYRTNKKIPLDHIQPLIQQDITRIKTIYQTHINEKDIKEVLLCFAKHNYFYHKQMYSSNYAWITAALMYHADMCTIFWVLDALCDVFGLAEEEEGGKGKLGEIAERIYSRVGMYFNEGKNRVEREGVELRKVVRYLVSDLMLSFIPVEYGAYSVYYVLEKGTVFFEKLVLSYLDKRFEAVKKKHVRGRVGVLMCLLNNEDEWPIIFCGMNSFKLEP